MPGLRLIAAAADGDAVGAAAARRGRAFVVAPEQRTPEYLHAFVVREIARWSAAIKAAGISME